jgi:transposase InsO family protein
MRTPTFPATSLLSSSACAVAGSASGSVATTSGFLQRAVAGFAALDIRLERLLVDNGSAYRSLSFAEACLKLGISQRFTRAHRPQTNGKAERFICTLLTEWAYYRA